MLLLVVTLWALKLRVHGLHDTRRLDYLFTHTQSTYTLLPASRVAQGVRPFVVACSPLALSFRPSPCHRLSISRRKENGIDIVLYIEHMGTKQCVKSPWNKEEDLWGRAARRRQQRKPSSGLPGDSVPLSICGWRIIAWESLWSAMNRGSNTFFAPWKEKRRGEFVPEWGSGWSTSFRYWDALSTSRKRRCA